MGRQSSTTLQTPSDKRTGRMSVVPTVVAAPTTILAGIRLTNIPTAKAAASALTGARYVNALNLLRNRRTDNWAD